MKYLLRVALTVSCGRWLSLAGVSPSTRQIQMLEHDLNANGLVSQDGT